MTINETAQSGRVAAGLAASAGGLAMAVTGVMQAMRPMDDDPRVLGEEHLLLGLFAASLILLVPGLVALARHGGRTALVGAVVVSAGHVLLAFGATSSNLRGEDYAWFPFVAVPANLGMLVGDHDGGVAVAGRAGAPRRGGGPSGPLGVRDHPRPTRRRADRRPLLARRGRPAHLRHLADSPVSSRSVVRTSPDGVQTSPSSEGDPGRGEQNRPPAETLFAWGSEILRGFAAGASVVLAVMFGWAIVVGLILGLVGALLGMDPNTPELDKFFDDYFEPVYYGLPGLAVLVGGGGWGILRLLERREERADRHAIVLESRAKAVQDVVRESASVSEDLDREIAEKLARLTELSARLEAVRKEVQLTEEQTRMVDVVIGKHLVGQARAQLVQQVVFLVLAFLLGFVVNWLSTPALDTLRGWWTT
ncbi:hypothetical protein ACFQE7_43535 [Nonomuraea ferruginea]|uniref:hypothetical protein n=1 Tax=Nonomuraea ferruginea TaxID=46174 RepID=UPI003622EACA